MTNRINLRGTQRFNFGSFLILRAIPAAGLALAITFSANHSSVVGQIGFIAFAFVTAPILLLTGWGGRFNRLGQVLYSLESLLTVAAATTMAILVGTGFTNAHDGLAAFTVIVGCWAAASALCEFLTAWFSAQREEAREMFLIAALLAVLALIELVFPVNDVFAVGVFGAFGAILAVVSAIAGFTLINSPAKQKAESR